MRVHSLNAGTMEPPSHWLTNGDGSLFRRGRIVCHCLMLKTEDGICLVDTGIGTHDIAQPEKILATGLGRARPRLSRHETLIVQLSLQGIAPDDVRHIIMTHMDRDHAGGLADFPNAKIHLSINEYRAAVTGEITVPLERYAKYQWAHGPDFAVHEDFVIGPMGLSTERLSLGRDEVFLVALAGHTVGHCGVLLADEDGWLLHAGDAFYHRRQIATPQQPAPPLLRLLEWKAQMNRPERLASLSTVRRIAARGEVRVICTHDAAQFDLMRAHNAME